MTYKQTIKYLEGFQKYGDKPGMHRIKKLLKLLDNPHKKLKYVHVTGTNGKGSTCAMIASILNEAGYKTGLFTSPHLHKYNERIKINGIDISDRDFLDLFKKVKTAAREMIVENYKNIPALFEVITAMAFLYFAEKKVDIAVMEVGKGGRLDTTNIIDSIISIITNVDLEHTDLLGKTKKAIARQKAGIIKPDSTVITSEQDKKIQNIFKETAKKYKSDFIYLKQNDIKFISQSVKGQIFNFQNYKNLKIPLLGKHQLKNASVAVLCADSLNKYGFKINKSDIKKGLANTKWPLRLEYFNSHPSFLIDVGHNLHGVKTIHDVVKELFSNKKKIMILGCSNDKPYKQMSALLSKESDVIIVTKARYHGVEQKEIIKSISQNGKKIYNAKNVKEAIKLAKKIAKKNDLIMVLGGLYLGAEAKECIYKDLYNEKLSEL